MVKKAGVILGILLLIFCVNFVSAAAINVDINDTGCIGANGQPDPYSIVYCSIQDAIDDASAGDEIQVAAGTYNEDLVINKSSLNLVGNFATIKGILTVPIASWPLATPNIEILSDDVKLHSFIIESPDYVSGFYSSGIVIGSKNVEIYDNDFIINSAGTIDEISQVIQTYATSAIPGVDISSLKIHNNTFNSTGTGTWGYEGIYINHDAATNIIIISDNDFTGKILRAITTERSKTTISRNNIVTDLTPSDLSVAGALAGAYQGINVRNLAATLQSQVTIENNFITGSDSSKGFYQGIRIGQNKSQILSNFDIKDNVLKYNTNGILVKSSNGVKVNYNEIISNIDYGIKSEDVNNVLNTTYNWWGDCKGPGPVGPGSGNNVSDNVTYTPWLGICITNKTNETCAFETENVTLKADLEGILIDSARISYIINSTNYNKTASIIGNKIQATIPSNELIGGQNMAWNVYVNDNTGRTYNNSWKEFYVRKKTYLGIIPWPFDGLNKWYITEPTFTLVPDASYVNAYYRWDSTEPFLYAASFGLDNIPNAPPKKSAGTLKLNWWAEFSCGNESEQNYAFYVDLTDPLISDLQPANGSTVYNNKRPEISAYLDEIWQSNSGINKDSVIIKLDGNVVPATVKDADKLDAIVSYILNYDLNTNITHNVSVYVEDEAGRSSSLIWFFNITITPVFTIVVHSPEEKNYGEKRILVDVSLTEEIKKLEIIDYSDKKPRWKILCRRCDGYSRKRSSKDGNHKIGIRGTDYFENQKEINISFFVDSKKPRISRTLPGRNSFTNGSEFYIKYTEDNLQNILLFYGTETESITKYDCEPGRNKECVFNNINLTAYNGQYIDYWFEVSDSVNTVESRKIRVKIDATSPVLTVNSPINDETYGRKVPFNITVSEGVTLEYIDNSASRPRWRRLCSRCDDYGNTRKKMKSFKKGIHNIDIRATDKAGNSDVEEVSFTVDY